MEKISLKAEKRTPGRKPLKLARREGYVPAVIYGHNFQTVPLQVKVKDFEAVYGKAGESSLVYIELGEQSLPAIIHEVSRDTLSDQVLHTDFYKVRLDKKITAEVPLVFVGEAPAVKNLGGILVKNVSGVKIEALPQDLPHEITVDVSKLENFGTSLHIKDLALPKGTEIKENPDETIVLIQEPISQEELDKQLAVTEGGVEDVEVIKKEKEEEVPVEGEASVPETTK